MQTYTNVYERYQTVPNATKRYQMHTNDTDNDNDSDNDSDNDNDNDNDNDSDNDKNNESVSFSAKKECVFNTRFIKIYNRLAPKFAICHFQFAI